MTEVASGIQVLHVDDEPGFTDLAADFLERQDNRLRVRTAAGVDPGLTALDRADIDCVVSDYDMPERSGIEFLERVRADYPDLSFILYTGKGSEEVASEAISAGVTDYLQKETGTGQYAVLANRVTNAVEADQSATEARRRRHRLEQILKTVPGCVVRLDCEGQFVFANRRAEEVLGLEQAELTDRAYNDPEWNIRDMNDEPIPDEQLPFWRVKETGEELYGARHKIEWPDGTQRVLLVNGAPLFGEDGGVDSVVFSLTDITDQRDQKRELTKTRRRLKLAFAATDTGVWEWDLETDDVVWSETLERVMGVDPGEFEGTFEAFADYVHPEDLPRVSEQIEEAVETDSMYQAEFRMTSDDGDTRWVDVRGQLVRDGDSERMVGVHHDVTERKEGERKLEQQNERLKEFANVVSHDLRNPLQVAKGRLELVPRDTESGHLAQVDRALSRIEHIIDDVLWLARVGQDSRATESVPLRETVEAAWAVGAGGTDGAELVVETGRPGGLGSVDADPNRLQQLFESLFRNSVEHGSASGRPGTDDGEDVAVTVTVGSLDGGFYVADDGPGIPASERERVFESGDSTSDDGVGFGLRIVERIAEAHGWTVRATEGNGGSRFEVTGVERTEQQ